MTNSQTNGNIEENKIFEKKKLFVILIIIILLGLVLRIIVGNNANPLPDAINFGLHAIDFINSGAISNQNQSPVWFILTDIFYKIFGVTLFSASFTSILYGTLIILLVFLIAKELFNKQIALISSILFAISAFAIRNTIMEMDPTFTFFSVLAIYFFVRKLFRENKVSLVAFIFYGVAVLSKPISLMIAPGFVLVYFAYYLKNKENKQIILGKENFRRWIIGIIISALFLLPLIVYNYILYKERGLTDVMVARFFGTSMEFYASIAHTMSSFSVTRLFGEGLTTPVGFFYQFDPIILFLAGLGIAFCIKNKNFNSLMLGLSFFPVYVFLSGTSLLPKHFLVFIPVLAIYAAIPLHYLYKKFKSPYFILVLVVAMAIFNIYLLGDVLVTKSAVGKLRDFTIDNVGDNDLVIADGRIYGGQIAWIFNDKHYVDAIHLNGVFNELEKYDSSPVNLRTFFIECAADDCGWGTIGPGEFNNSMESLTLEFANISKKSLEFTSGGGDLPEANKQYYKIYEARLSFKPEILNIVDQTHIWFFYPVRWKLEDRIYDKYSAEGFLDKFLNNFSRLVLYFAVVLAIFAIYLVIRLTIKETK